MKLNRSWQIRLAQISLGAALVIALVVVRGTSAQNDPVHMATDWSHRYLVFSTPKTLVDRFQASSNPRYVQQWVRRNAEKKVDREAWRWARAQPDPMKKDWSMNMGNNATMGQGMYPAKYSFDVSTANCANTTQPDFAVYNTSLAGNSNLVAATDSGTFLAVSAPGDTITITNGATVLTMTAIVGPNSGTNYSIGGNATIQATNFRAAMVANVASVGLNPAGGAGTNVTFSAVTPGLAGNNIAVASSNIARFAWVAPKFAGGATGRASIMAFDNLYSGCPAPQPAAPSVYWAYNTGGTANTSIALSYDGTQVAFIQNVAGVGTLVVLKWKASATDNFNNPTTLIAVSNAAYRTCIAPCMTTITFSNTGVSRQDLNSAPFYDFATDNLYVGDAGGRLRKFTGVFLGTPAETLTGPTGWPVTLGGVAVTTSALYDGAVGKVFIGDSLGFLYSVTTSSVAPLKVTSGRLGFSLGGITDAPIIDPTAGTVHVIVANDTSGGTPLNSHTRVYQLSDTFTAASIGTSVTVGDSSTLKVFRGDFDNAYYASPTGTLGNLYVCGYQVALTGNQVPTLWQIPMVGGSMGASIPGPALTTAVGGGTTCSPVSEVFNPNALGGPKDWIFLSVVNRALAGSIGCTGGGCIMSFDITNVTNITPINAGTATAARLPVTGGTSGVSVDNTVGAGTLAGASQVYFTPLANQVCTTSGGTGGCAIQASQSGLI